MQTIRVKRAFTLIELILVILLTSSVYYLMFSNSNFLIKETKDKFLLENTKEYLINNFEFNDEISLVCIEDDFSCFIKVDGEINTNKKVENVFKTIPEVYEYNQEQIRVDFQSVRINDIDNDVIFEFKINNDFKSKEYILDTLEDKVYMFNSLFQKAKIYDSLGEAFDTFEKNILEVKDAF